MSATLVLPNYITSIDTYTRAAAKDVEAANTRAKGGWVVELLCVPSLWPLYKLSGSLSRAIEYLNSNAIDDLSDQDVGEIAESLTQSTAQLAKLLSSAERLGLNDTRLYANCLRTIADRREHLQSILEGSYMSLEADTSEAIAVLARREAESRRDGPEKGSLPGCL